MYGSSNGGGVYGRSGIVVQVHSEVLQMVKIPLNLTSSSIPAYL